MPGNQLRRRQRYFNVLPRNQGTDLYLLFAIPSTDQELTHSFRGRVIDAGRWLDRIGQREQRTHISAGS